MNNTCILDGNEIEIVIVPALDAGSISGLKWDQLSKSSLFVNPFFSRQWLLSSIEYFLENKNINIVTLYYKGELIGLFPVIVYRVLRYWSFLMVWQHNHSFNVNPLLSRRVDFTDIFKVVATRLNCYGGRIHLHHIDLINSTNKGTVFQTPYSKAVIKNTSVLKDYLESNSGKFEKENRRLIRKAELSLNLEFFCYTDVHEGLSDFCELEHAGWKGRKRGSILSDSNVKAFYRKLASSAFGESAIQVMGLKSGDDLIACAMRVYFNDTFFEIKTCYNESFKEFAPGRLLEYYLLLDLSEKQGSVDSCTHSGNKLINRLWPDQIKLYSTLMFSSTCLARILNTLYKFKWLFKNYNV